MDSPFIFQFNSPDAGLETVGGKGANLARMARAGYPVPGGFLIGVAAYHAYVEAAQIAARIERRLAAARLDDPTALEQASGEIRALFSAAALPAALGEEICATYRAMGAPPVAVRSSATAEDLPEMSFAGQQDTYLNVLGEEALLRAVVSCWASLWTARAIGYRARQGIGETGLGLAVVVQEMVASEASGVLFTANPLTGLRAESVIDATLGLGEALVSGLVEPDHYVVDTARQTIVEKKLGAKALAIHPQAGGGTQTVRDDRSAQQALPDEAILALAALGQRVAAEYGSPQDIEWGWAGGRLYLLQTRAITSLFPVPDGLSAADLRVMISFGAVQGMLDPMTTLGRDIIASFAAAVAGIYGLDRNEDTQGVFRMAGERIWVDITELVRNPVGRTVVRNVLRFIEEGGAQQMETIWNDPRLLPTDKHLKFSTLLRVARGMRPVVARLLLALAFPAQRREAGERFIDRTLVDYRRACASVSGSLDEKLLRRVALMRSVQTVGPKLLIRLIPLLAAGMSQFYAVLRKQAGQIDAALKTDNHYMLLALEATRGMAGNVTTQMDLDLWDSAKAIRVDAPSLAAFRDLPAEQVAAAYHARALPPRALDVLDAFLEQYGMRGLAEIDMGRARWQEEPLHVIQVLGSYLHIEDPFLAPDAVFARGEVAGLDAIEKLTEGARRLPRGRLRAAQIRFAASRVRTLVSIRESPKFFVVRMFGALRTGLLDSGRDYVRLNLLDQPDDVFFLRLGELEALADGALPDVKATIAARRAAYEREMRRRQIPRLLLSDGRAFYEGMAAPTSADTNGLHGDPVSPGVAEGIAHVVLDPRGARLAPGEILVCPGTDPSWTPLFLAAGALVMEVGGMMTHGAVVAREYGIPAVVGVHQATTRLQSGQHIRVNGSTGEITLLDGAAGL